MSDIPSNDHIWELKANHPLSLDDPSVAWRVTEGRAQLFAISRRADGTQGARIPLFQVSAGEIILPFPEGSIFDLVAVGIDSGTTADSLPLARIIEDAASIGLGAAERRNMIETWVESLAAVVQVPNPRDGVELHTGALSEIEGGQAAWSIEEGQVVWPGTRTMWLGQAHELALFGTEVFAGEGDAPDSELWIPLPFDAWVRSTKTIDTIPHSGEEALASAAGWKGLEAFERAVLRILDSRRAEQEEAARIRMEQRTTVDQEMIERSYSALGSILEEQKRHRIPISSSDDLYGAFQVVGEYLGIQVSPPPKSAGTGSGSLDPIELIARATGVRTREVVLESGWWNEDVGPLLGRIATTGRFVALLPRSPGKYEMVDPTSGTRTKVDEEVISTLHTVATMVYAALPGGQLSGRDILKFVLAPVAKDLRRLAILGLAAGAVSLVTPIVTKTIFSSVVPGLQKTNLYWLAVLLVVFAIGSFCFAVVQQLSLARVEGRSAATLQAAIWDRVLDLPLPFFRRFSSGDLTQRVMAIEQIRMLATSTVAMTLFALPIGIFNFAFAFVIQPVLALFGLIILIVTGVLMFLLTRYQIVQVTKVVSAQQKTFGLALQLVDAVGKLRVANAESRAFSQWANRFSELKKSFYGSQLGFAGVTAFSAGVSGLITLMLFLGAATLGHGTLSGSTFIAFNTAFMQASSSVLGLSSIAIFLAQAVPLYRSAKPVLQESREADTIQADPGELTGKIEVSHVTLRYSEDSPPVLNDVSFSIEPGEFVAVVGPSGAGKSTIMRLLLGFEKPELGTVRYDGQDLDTIDLKSVRRQLGVVTQSVRLLPGDLVTNIIGNRQLTVDDAWAAAEVAGMAEDIKAMPMGMQTFVSEGAGTFSGGQRQRLLIARAVAGKPRVLLFDEATSALDNQTQAQVASAISRLRATRIVIAHRLSTIRDADRILVLSGGHIVQQGSFAELMDVDGPFRELAQRQLA